MHDDHVFLGPGQQGVVNAVRILDLQPLFLVGEPLLLHSCDVQNVSIRQDLVEGFADRDRDTGLTGCSDNIGGHGKRWGSNEVEADRVEAKKGDEAVDGPSVLQIAKKGDGASIHSSQLRTNSVDVQ